MFDPKNRWNSDDDQKKREREKERDKRERQEREVKDRYRESMTFDWTHNTEQEE